MPRLNFEVDEATILKTYKIGSLNPTYVFDPIYRIITRDLVSYIDSGKKSMTITWMTQFCWTLLVRRKEKTVTL